jgi:hypothetical protein
MQTQPIHSFHEHNLALVDFWAWAEHVAAQQPFTAQDVANTARVMWLSYETGQFSYWPEAGVLLWLRCSDRMFEWIRKRQWQKIFAAPVSERSGGPNIVVTETVILQPGIVYAEVRRLSKLPGIRRIGGFRRGRWREHRVS